MAKKEYSNLGQLLKKEWNSISFVFLGVGLVLFLLNLTAMLGLTMTFGAFEYSYLGFDASIFSSILLILYVVYSLSTKSGK